MSEKRPLGESGVELEMDLFSFFDKFGQVFDKQHRGKFVVYFSAVI